MNERQAEAVLALWLEVDNALEIAEAGSDLKTLSSQFAAERALERIFQAAEGVDPKLRESYFGPGGVQHLRGMRNRLAHNYLGVDLDVIRETFRRDLPRLRDGLFDDCQVATAIIMAGPMDVDEIEWLNKHHHPLHLVEVPEADGLRS